MSSQAAYHLNPLFTRVPRVAHVKCRAGIVVCRTRRPPAAAVSRKEATVSPTAVDGGKQRTANLLLCACYQIRAALNARSPTVSAARLRPPAVYNHRPPLSLCHRELSSSLPGSPLHSPDPPLAAHFEDEKTQDISSQRECFEFHVLRRPAAPNNGALFCGLFFPTARSHYQLSGLSSYNLK